MLLFGLPIVGGDISFWFLRLADRYILRIFRSAYEVGIYSVGYDLSDRSLGILISLLAMSSWPLVVQTWERKGVQATSSFLTQLMKLYLLICIPAVVAISLLRMPIMNIMADKLYFEANQIIPLIVSSVFFFGFQRWFQLVLALYKKTHFIMISVLGGAVVNIVLNVVFVPSFGYLASAIINVIGYALFALLIVLFSRPLMAWKFPFASLRNSFLSSAFMAAGILGVISTHLPEWAKLIICIPIGLMLYVIALFVIKELSFGDVMNFTRSWFHKAE
jgi:O-antigen/teichoic acid export membrane protein